MTPAKLDLTLIRGITFGPIKFLFSSAILGSATVDLANNVFICANHGLAADDPVRFRSDTALPIGISAAVTYYVLAAGLTSSNFTVSTAPGGSPVVLIDIGTGSLDVLQPADMTGYVPSSEVRDVPNGILIMDLQPSLTGPDYGEVTIPVITPATSMLLPADGGLVRAKWDIVSVIPTGERLGPYIAGAFNIKSNITEPVGS